MCFSNADDGQDQNDQESSQDEEDHNMDLLEEVEFDHDDQDQGTSQDQSSQQQSERNKEEQDMDQQVEEQGMDQQVENKYEGEQDHEGNVQQIEQDHGKGWQVETDNDQKGSKDQGPSDQETSQQQNDRDKQDQDKDQQGEQDKYNKCNNQQEEHQDQVPYGEQQSDQQHIEREGQDMKDQQVEEDKNEEQQVELGNVHLLEQDHKKDWQVETDNDQKGSKDQGPYDYQETSQQQNDRDKQDQDMDQQGEQDKYNKCNNQQEKHHDQLLYEQQSDQQHILEREGQDMKDQQVEEDKYEEQQVDLGNVHLIEQDHEKDWQVETDNDQKGNQDEETDQQQSDRDEQDKDHQVEQDQMEQQTEQNQEKENPDQGQEMRSKKREEREILKAFGMRRRVLKLKKEPYRGNKRAVSVDVEEDIIDFYNDDLNVMHVPNKKHVSKRTGRVAVISNKTVRKQHQDYVAKSGRQIGKTAFYKRRPKYVKPKSKLKFVQNLCEKCENLELKINSLRRQWPGCPFSDKYGLIDHLLCTKDKDRYHKRDCYEGKCKACQQRIQDFATDLQEKLPSKMTFFHWQVVKETTSDGKIVSRKWRVKLETTKVEFIENLTEPLFGVAMHLHKACWQHQQYSKKIQAMKPNEVLIAMDYAEKWRTTWQCEVTQAHYGYKTVTVFPMVTHYQCPVCPKVVKESIIIVSDSKVEDADHAASYVEIATDHLENNRNIKIDRIIQKSDNCAKQFKGNRAFYRLTENKHKTEHMFTEPGHGKCTCDGEGAVVKTYVTEFVKSYPEALVENAEDFKEACNPILTKGNMGIHELHDKSKVIRTMMVSNETKETSVPPLRSIPGTTSIKHLKALEAGKVSVRDQSCFCAGCENDTECQNSGHVDDFIQHDLHSRSNKRTSPQYEKKKEKERKVHNQRKKGPQSENARTKKKPAQQRRQARARNSGPPSENPRRKRKPDNVPKASQELQPGISSQGNTSQPSRLDQKL